MADQWHLCEVRVVHIPFQLSVCPKLEDYNAGVFVGMIGKRCLPGHKKFFSTFRGTPKLEPLIQTIF